MRIGHSQITQITNNTWNNGRFSYCLLAEMAHCVALLGVAHLHHTHLDRFRLSVFRTIWTVYSSFDRYPWSVFTPRFVNFRQTNTMNGVEKWLDDDEYLFTKPMHAYVESRIIWDLKRLPKSVFRVKKKRLEDPEYRYSVSVLITK